MFKLIFDWLKSFIIAILIVAIFSIFFGFTKVIHASMTPTLQDSDYLLFYKKGEIKNGDIVVFSSDLRVTKGDIENLPFYRKLFTKEGDRKLLIKRVIAKGGQRIQIRDSKVYVNDTLLDEYHYIKGKTPGDVDLVVPENKIFVMGDNRENSVDSRSFGVVDLDDVKGRVLIRLFPFDEIKIFRGL